MGQALRFLPGKNGAGPAVSVPTQSRNPGYQVKSSALIFRSVRPERGYHQDALISQPLAKHLGLSHDKAPFLVSRSTLARQAHVAEGTLGSCASSGQPS